MVEALYQPPLAPPPSPTIMTQPFEYQRIQKPLKKCSEMSMNLTDVNYSEEDLKTSYCMEFTSKTEIGGGFKEGLYKTIQIAFISCRPSPEIKCIVQRKDSNGASVGLPFSTFSTSPSAALLDNFSEYYKDLVIQIGFIEDLPGLKEFEKPIIRNLVWIEGFKINYSQLFAYNFVLAQTKVDTLSGLISKETTSS